LGFETITDTFSNGGDKKLCKTVNGLNRFLMKMDEQYKLEKETEKQQQKTQQMAPHGGIAKVSLKIYDLIRNDNYQSMMDCSQSLEMDKLLDPCLIEIQKNATDENSIYTAFEETYKQMIVELTEKQKIANRDSRQIAYQLLWFGDQTCKFKKNYEVEEKLKWALELFAADLAVYSFRHDHPTEGGTQGEIQKIVEEWLRIRQHYQQQMTKQQVETIEPIGTE
jgi:carboxypeptidase C (cathepsin A)